jgi:hypothetical protein
MTLALSVHEQHAAFFNLLRRIPIETDCQIAWGKVERSGYRKSAFSSKKSIHLFKNGEPL